MEEKHPLTALVDRLNKIGITIQLVGNFPWVYLDTVNGQRVKEKQASDHYYTIGFLPIKPDVKFKFLDTTELFKIIRKYK